MIPHNKICVLPWISLEATPHGAIRPCCLSTTELPETVNDGLSTAYQSNTMVELRQAFRNKQKPEGCNRCWSEESAGRTSKRQWHLRKFSRQLDQVDWNNDHPDQLWFIDLKLGNICNLKCRICGTWSSSKWAQEEMDHQSLGNSKETRAYIQLKQGEWPRKTDTFWNDLETLLPHVKYFEFTGGEPFLIREHFDLLERAVELGHARNISIHYNTNGTTWPDTQAWKHFKNVEIAFSIDNTGDRFEIERSGADWTQVQHTISCAKELRNSVGNVILQVCITINIQNVLYLEDICHWVAQQQFDMIYFNMLHDPAHMNIANMTARAKELVISRLQSASVEPRFQTEIDSVIKFIEQGAGSDGTKFVEFMKRTDANRTENFAQTHAEIAEAMGYGS